MQKTAIFALVLLSAMVAVHTAAPQTPKVTAYYELYSDFPVGPNEFCPVAPIGTVVDTLYVVAEQFNMWMNAIEYKIDYPAQIQPLGDIILHGGLSIGDSQSGIAVAYPIPANAFDKLTVQKVVFLWMCDRCGIELTNKVFYRVSGYPSSGKIRAVRWPDLAISEADGGWSSVCAMVPVENSTWGKIKALYD